MSRLRRVRLGEMLALAGAGCVIAFLLTSSYGGAYRGQGASPSGELSAWASFGPTVVLLILGCVGALALVAANLFERSPALPMAIAVWSTLFGLAASVCAIVRIFERPHGASTLQVGAWLALAGGVAIFVGSWQSMRDERQSLYAPVEVPPRRQTDSTP